jgi:hypothetical protein
VAQISGKNWNGWPYFELYESRTYYSPTKSNFLVAVRSIVPNKNLKEKCLSPVLLTVFMKVGQLHFISHSHFAAGFDCESSVSQSKTYSTAQRKMAKITARKKGLVWLTTRKGINALTDLGFKQHLH